MRIRSALSGVLFLLLASCCTGQEITATILGTVTDPTGAVIATNCHRHEYGSGIVARRLTTSLTAIMWFLSCPSGTTTSPPEAAGFKTSREDRH